MADLLEWLDECKHLVNHTSVQTNTGKLTRVAGLVMEAVGLKLPVGSVCTVVQKGTPNLEAEVVGFNGDRLFLMPSTDVHGMTPGAKVIPLDPPPMVPKLGTHAHPWRRPEDKTKHLPVGDSLLGRVVDSNGRPLDSLGELQFEKRCPLAARPINPLEREPIHEHLDVGVRAINALLTVGRGQRIGLMAGSGVGKSVLLGMMARYTKADRVVVGLIGERGREVKEFIEQILGEEGLKRSVVIAAPADVSPLLRMQGAAYTQVVAEHFRDQGHNVLMIMDSLTRYAMAQREIALAIGEPPATKGYPPSVFAKLPALVERAGNGRPGGGSITAFYTVLTEGDDQQDPIADAARAILDGHIVLNRQLAEQGHYPAIDIEQSISRAMHNIVPPEHLNAARHLKAAFSRVQRNRDLITVGAYAPGADPQLDQSLALYPQIEKLLQQSMLESASFEEALGGLQALFPNEFNQTSA
ncbi:flagellar protein export ATPase FliI [Limnobacter humi]|uniref:Flagellum-specific ATP synthase n=1 Tax=Limnobacter humi TaxID=1778671 RepID=A0ABT1WKU0_9BURK|nr:flagellar protein export ATPase FliI [Limnobacter humi]MCQ8897758.1 flagellar protein export ATPase FliI [Limnobacter humi]